MSFQYLTKISLIFFVVFLLTGCKTLKTVEGTNPYSVTIPEGKMVLVDMGYVEGTIKGKKLHAYRILYHQITPEADHIYILENENQINITQSYGKTEKHISVIIENDSVPAEREEYENN